jgi:four helix bundle protein
VTGKINSYRDLIAWQTATAICLEIYRVTKAFPPEERFGLTSQLRRAAVSVPSNIAEGYGRGRPADYLRFLRTARGSLFEIETQLYIATELGFLGETQYQQLDSKLKECGRVLAGLIRSINAD